MTMCLNVCQTTHLLLRTVIDPRCLCARRLRELSKVLIENVVAKNSFGGGFVVEGDADISVRLSAHVIPAISKTLACLMFFHVLHLALHLITLSSLDVSTSCLRLPLLFSSFLFVPSLLHSLPT